MAPPPTEEFEAHCSSCVRALQASLSAVFGTVDVDVTRPQHVARRLGLNKNLTWKIAKVVQCDDPMEAVSLVPGTEGMGILLGALRQNGADTAALDRVRGDYDAFSLMMRAHAGDRVTFDLLVDGMSRGGKSLEVSRKLAFRGNSGVWGLQARVRSGLQVIAPNRESPDRLDHVTVSGSHDIRRLRPVQGWPVFRLRKYGQGVDGEAVSRVVEPIEPAASPDEPAYIVRSFCSPPGAELQSVRTDSEIVHQLVDGPIGQRGSVSFVVGSIERAAFPRYAGGDADDSPFGELVVFVTMPTELVVVDFLVHRSMEAEVKPEVIVHGWPFGVYDASHPERQAYRLPISEGISRLEPGPDGFAFEPLPDRAALIRTALQRGGWREDEFVAFRVAIPYPPMSSSVMIRYRLPAAP